MAHWSRRNKCSRGFTLIELLVVISIISVLVAILLPALSRARESAITLQCQSNQRQMGIALMTYENDFDQLPHWNLFVLHSNNWNANVLARALVGHIGMTPSGPQNAFHTKLMLCPGDPNRELYHTARDRYDSYHYRGNAGRRSGFIDYGDVPIQTWNWPGPYAQGYNKWLTLDMSRGITGLSRVDRFISEHDTVTYPAVPIPDGLSFNGAWHDGGVNALYHDGHVKWVPYGTAVSE